MRRKHFVMPKPIVDNTPKVNIYTHIEKVDEVAKLNHHLLGKWETFGSRYSSSYGSSNDHTATNKCVLCGLSFYIEMYPKYESTMIEPCLANPNKIVYTKNENGLAVTTWEFCGVCGKKLGTDSAKLRGFCNEEGCQNRGKLVIETGKWNKFYPLTKLPKESPKSRFPIFNHVLVIVENGSMIVTMPIWNDDKLNFVEPIVIDEVKGNCRIGVRRNVFVDIIQSMNEQDIEFSMDSKKMEMYIDYKNSKTVFKGLDAEEFPSLVK